jgi:hypothetical protein
MGIFGKKRKLTTKKNDMLKSIFLSVFSLLMINLGFSQAILTDSLYLGQAPPGNIPKIFKLPVTKGTALERIAFSPDGKQIYYTELSGWNNSSQHRIKYLSYANNKWNGPFTLFEGYMAPSLSLNGDTIYFDDTKPKAWYSVKNDTGWGTPKKIWVDSCQKAQFQSTNKGNLYFSTNLNSIVPHGVIAKLVINHKDSIAQSLGAPINSSDNGVSFFVAKDESYLIFTSNRNKSHMLVISYRKNDDTWTNFKSLGPTINFPGGWPWGAYVTKDNKYLFYSNGSNPSNSGTYWVKIGNLIDSLRKSNFDPYLKNQIKDQAAKAGHYFTYTIPENTFIDDDGNNTLTYSAALSDGNPLPSWLNFDAKAKKFSGKPSNEENVEIKISVMDPEKASISDVFKLKITK